jgi:hypothetical protein
MTQAGGAMKPSQRALRILVLIAVINMSAGKLWSQAFVCPKAELKSSPHWFPLSHPQVDIAVRVDRVTLDCEGLPLEVNVPNKNAVRISVAHPADYSCAATAALSPLNRPNAIKDVVDLVKQVGAFFVASQDTFTLPAEAKKETVTVTIKCHSRSKSDAELHTDAPEADAEPQSEMTTKPYEKPCCPPAPPPPTPAATEKVVVSYGPPARVSASAGFILTSGVRSYGVKATNLGNVGGVANIQSRAAITSSPSAQVVPFTFANVYLRGSPKTHVDLQFGLGLNPNLSSTKIEFFAGPALSWHDLYFSPGIHIGQHENVANGFHVGDIVPNGSKLPTSFKYFSGFGFSVSYNLHPLASAIGSK